MKTKLLSILIICLACLLMLSGCDKIQKPVTYVTIENTERKIENIVFEPVPIADPNEVPEEQPEDQPEEESNVQLDNSSAIYMGGLYVENDKTDLKLALFSISGIKKVVIIEGNDLYYGEFDSENDSLPDGTEYLAITLHNTTFGYHFNDDSSGILVDKEKNKYDAKELDETDAREMLKKVYN